jgi:hypothetical protein
MTSTTRHSLLDRSAVRFLLARREGRLETGDPATGEVFAGDVTYLPQADGSFMAILPHDTAHLKAIRNGGVCMLSVQGDEPIVTPRLFDENGLPTADAVAHVRACVTAQPIDTTGLPMEHGVAVRLNIRNLQAYLHTVGRTRALMMAS